MKEIFLTTLVGAVVGGVFYAKRGYSLVQQMIKSSRTIDLMSKKLSD